MQLGEQGADRGADVVRMRDAHTVGDVVMITATNRWQRSVLLVHAVDLSGPPGCRSRSASHRVENYRNFRNQVRFRRSTAHATMAVDRKSVVSGTCVSVRVNSGGCRRTKKPTNHEKTPNEDKVDQL